MIAVGQNSQVAIFRLGVVGLVAVCTAAYLGVALVVQTVTTIAYERWSS
jgi:Zn-dependent alcohol dehydrogenase